MYYAEVQNEDISSIDIIEYLDFIGGARYMMSLDLDKIGVQLLSPKHGKCNKQVEHRYVFFFNCVDTLLLVPKLHGCGRCSRYKKQAGYIGPQCLGIVEDQKVFILL